MILVVAMDAPNPEFELRIADPAKTKLLASLSLATGILPAVTCEPCSINARVVVIWRL